MAHDLTFETDEGADAGPEKPEGTFESDETLDAGPPGRNRTTGGWNDQQRKHHYEDGENCFSGHGQFLELLNSTAIRIQSRYSPRHRFRPSWTFQLPSGT